MLVEPANQEAWNSRDTPIGRHLVLCTTGLGDKYKIFPDPGGIFVAKTKTSVPAQMKFSLAALLLLVGSVAAANQPRNYDEFIKSPAKYLKKVAEARDAADRMQKLMKACNVLVPGKEIDQSRAGRIYDQINTYLRDENNSNREQLFNAALPVFGYFLDRVPRLPSEVTKRLKADPSNIKLLLTYLVSKDATKIKFANVPSELILAGGSDAFSVLQGGFGTNNPILHQPHEALWKAFASMKDTQTYEQMCNALLLPTLESLNEAATKTFKPECIAQTKLGESRAVNISRYPSNVFSLYDKRISEHVAKGLTGPQTAAIGTGLKNEATRCSKVPLPQLTKTAIANATLACIMSYVADPSNPSLEKKWEPIKEATFDGLALIKDKDILAMFAKRLINDDWDNMSRALQSKLLSIPGIAKNIPESVEFKRVSDVRLKGKDLAQVKNQQIINMNILTKDPDTEIFAYFTAEHARSLEIKGRRGLAVLDLMTTTDPKTKEQIIANISIKLRPDQEHACASINAIEEYRAIKAFQTYKPSKKCLKAARIDLDQAAADKNKELLAALPYAKVIELYNKADLGKISSSKLAEIIKGDFCSQVTPDVFDAVAVNLDNLHVIDSRCVRMLLGRFPLAPERTTRFGDKAFVAITYAQFTTHLSFAHINDKQLPHLSMEVSVKDSVMANVESAAVAALGSRARYLSSKQVANMKDTALSALKIKDLAPASLTDLTPDQITRFVSQFGDLSKEQVQKIGANHSDQRAVATVLRKYSNLLNTAGREALKARFPEPNNSASSATPSAIAIGVAAIVAGAFLF